MIMKKTISIFLVLILCLSMCSVFSGCGSNEIKLTLDNYDNYLEIHGGIVGTEKKETDNDYWFGAFYQGYKFVENDFYTGCSGYLRTEVVAPNYNFHNVTIKIHFTGIVLAILENSNPDSPTTKSYNIDFYDTFELNVGGTVKDGKRKILDLPQNLLILSQLSDNYNGKYSIKDVSWEIVEISGAVSPA